MVKSVHIRTFGLIFISFIVSFLSFAQKQGNIWYFGGYAGLNFNSGSPVALTNSAMYQYEGCASICDSNGVLQFYTNGMTIWNRTHVIMNNGSGLKGGYPSTQSSIIVPKPNSTSIYYVFTIDDVAGPDGLEYSIVDMTQQSGLGSVTSKNNLLLTPTTEKVTAVKHRNKRDVWVITHAWGNNSFYAYLITPSGISSTPIITNVGVAHSGSLTKASGYLKASPDGSKLALAITHMAGTVEIFDFDDSSGVLSNPITFTNYQDPYGIEFSPDGTKLYVSARSLGQIHQFDLGAGNAASIYASRLTVGTSLSQVGALQVANNGRLYVARISTYLGVINNPNKYGTICNYVDNGVYLAGKQSQFGLPTFNQSYFYNPEFSAANTCFGDSTKFTILNTIFIDSVRWNFGDTASNNTNISRLFSPIHIFTRPGNFTVQLIAYHLYARDTINWSVKINPRPDANFTINDTVQCANWNSVIFTNTSTIQSGTMRYNWSMGDGFKSTATNLGYKYPYADTFSVTLISTSTFGCADTIKKKVYIDPSPDVSFEMNDSAQCFDRNKYEFFNYSWIDWGTMTYLWKFGDGFYSSLKDPTHTYTSADTFLVSLIATSNKGCVDTLSKEAYVHVHPSPIADFSVDDTSQCFPGNSFRITNNSSVSTGTITFDWAFGDGDSSKATNPIHAYDTDGVYTIRLTVISTNGCKDRLSQKVKVNPMPKSDFTINDNTQCLNLNNVTFSNKTTIYYGNMTYYWNFGDGGTSNLRDPVHKFTSSDSFNVTMIASSQEGCSDTTMKKVYIYAIPLVDFNINNDVQCLKGNNFIFSNQTNIQWGTISNYFWNLGDGYTTSTKDASRSYAIAKQYDVKLVATSDKGCKDSITKKITINPNPKADFSISDKTQCFRDNIFYFNDSSFINGGFITSYTWNTGDSTVYSTKKIFHNYNYPDTFLVKLVLNSDKNCKDSITYPVFVYANPLASFTVNDKTQCLKNNNFVFTNTTKLLNGAIKTWNWDFGDTKTATTQHTNHAYSTFNSFKTTLIAVTTFGCSDTFSDFLSVFPMPVSSFTINDNTQCLNGNNFIFTNSSSIPAGSISAYNWNFNDGNYSTAINPTHVYTSDKQYKVELVVVSNSGCVDTSSKNVIVAPMPRVDFSFSQPCLDASTDFSDLTTINTPGSISSWLWDFGDLNTSTSKNPGHSYSTPDTYTIFLEATSDRGCKSSNSKNLVIREHVSSVSLKRATVEPNGDVLVEWEAPATGAPKNYLIERSNDGYSWMLTGKVPATTFSYIDKTSNPDQHSVYYRIQAEDSCNYKSGYSNIGKTIFLSLNIDGDFPKLTWSKYLQWPSDLDYQIIDMKDEAGIFNEIKRISFDSFTFEDARNNLLLDEFCYRVTAYSKSDNTIFSTSNTVCRNMPLLVWVPNAFTPNNDGVNDTFKVTGKYILGLSMDIYNRWGELVFSTGDINHGWDGFFNGEVCETGPYYYFIRTEGPKDQRQEDKGILQLIR